MNSDLVIKQAFDALEETARIIRGQQAVPKCTKGKNAAVWHALLFQAVSRSVTKMQSLKTQLKAWIQRDLDACVPMLLGHAATKDDVTEEIISSSAAAETIHEAAVKRIVDSFNAYRRIAFAATVIFEVVESSATNKVNVKREMTNGYRDSVFPLVRDLLFDFIVGKVDSCRAKEDVMPSNGGLLKTACRLFSTIALQYEDNDVATQWYGENFVKKYHEHALAIARNSIKEYLQQPDALRGLLTWAEERIAFESNLVNMFIHDEEMDSRFSLRRFQLQLTEIFVAPHLSAIITDPNHGFAAALAAGNKEALKQQYKWAAKEKASCPHVPALVTKALEDYGRQRVTSVFTNFSQQAFPSANAAAASLVESMFSEMREIFDDIVNSVSDGEAAVLSRPVRKVMSQTVSKLKLTRRVQMPDGRVNTSENESFAEMLVVFLDMVLRDPKTLPSGETIHTMCSGASGSRSVADLFSLIADKDLFQEHYRLRLARRLLQPGAWEEDAEHAVLEVLQRIVGRVYTHKFEGMINDLTLQSDALTAKFRESLPRNDPDNATANAAQILEPRVLTAAFWPAHRRDKEFQPPGVLKMAMGVFERFYKRNYSTRELHWSPERSTAVLTAAFPKGQKEIQCTLKQAAVMMAIDSLAPKKAEINKSVTIAEVAHEVGMPVDEVKPLVASMLLAKGLNLLRKADSSSPPGKLTESDAMQMNPDFQIRLRKIRLPHAVLARDEPKGVAETIDASRAQMLDAAIIRIMKSRQKLHLREITSLTIDSVQSFFVAQPRQIKLRCEFLISKEYLERDADEYDLLSYLA